MPINGFILNGEAVHFVWSRNWFFKHYLHEL